MSAGAFRGDMAVKQDLLATIDRHVVAGTLVFDGTVWNGTVGSPLGIAIESDDAAVYAERYGYPLSLVGLLDPMMLAITDRDAALRAVRGWVEAATPGADLSRVPIRLVLRMLATPETRGIKDDLAARIVDLHERDAGGTPPSRADWQAVRQAVLAAEAPGERAGATLALWEACCWPASRGRSTVAMAYAKWTSLRSIGTEEHWTPADAARARATLETIWNEQEEARNVGDVIDYPALFQARDPELAAGFVADLNRANRTYLTSASTMADWCMTELSAAR